MLYLIFCTTHYPTYYMCTTLNIVLLYYILYIAHQINTVYNILYIIYTVILYSISAKQRDSCSSMEIAAARKQPQQEGSCSK